MVPTRKLLNKSRRFCFEQSFGSGATTETSGFARFKPKSAFSSVFALFPILSLAFGTTRLALQVSSLIYPKPSSCGKQSMNTAKKNKGLHLSSLLYT